MISLSDIKNAAERIAPYIRQTPLLQATCVSKKITEAELWLKLECLQPTGSFKVRGATNCLLTTPDTEIQRGIVTASGGNHGLAVARAASMAGVPATIFVPRTTSEAKLIKLAAWGATVKVEGSVWDEANNSALAFAAEHQCAYFHPFANPAVMAGQGTLALEILNELPDLDVILVAIGGGGLISGIASALKALKPAVRIIGIEPEGAPTLYASLQAGQVVTLPEITTAVATMACGRTDQSIFDVVRQSVDEIVLVSDQEMLEAARWLWFETGLAADLSGAAAAAALRAGKVRQQPGIKACALVCGSGQEGIG